MALQLDIFGGAATVAERFNGELMSIWTTRSWFTKGLQELTGLVHSRDDGALWINFNNGTAVSLKKGQWFLKKEDAIAHARKLKRRRVAYLSQKLEEVRAIEFN